MHWLQNAVIIVALKLVINRIHLNCKVKLKYYQGQFEQTVRSRHESIEELAYKLSLLRNHNFWAATFTWGNIVRDSHQGFSATGFNYKTSFENTFPIMWIMDKVGFASINPSDSDFLW